MEAAVNVDMGRDDEFILVLARLHDMFRHQVA
jgi:hypothetical protein